MSQHKMKVYSQYVKDLSFEKPNSLFLSAKETSSISVTVNINSVKLKGDEGYKEVNKEKESFYEVTLHIEAKATVKNSIAFICETKYCGIFSIENFSVLNVEEIRQALFIGGPTFLFPFAREIIARITSSGGFPPLMLAPIDFEAMYKKQQSQQQNIMISDSFN